MLTVESISKKIQKKLNIYLPQEIIQSRKGDRGKMLDYISGRVAVDILNYAFDYNWSWEVKKFWKEESEPVYLDNDKNHENGIPQGPIIHCLGTLTVYLKNEQGEYFKISKDGFGSKTVVGSQSKQEDNYKAAATDAIKKAATLLGVAAQLYRDNNEELFFNLLNDPWIDDEIFKKYKSEREYLRKLINYGVETEESLNKMLSEWTEDRFKNIQELTPDELKDFVEMLKAKKEVNQDGDVNE